MQDCDSLLKVIGLAIVILICWGFLNDEYKKIKLNSYKAITTVINGLIVITATYFALKTLNLNNGWIIALIILALAAGIIIFLHGFLRLSFLIEVKNWLLRNRLISLIISALLGVILLSNMSNMKDDAFSCIVSDDYDILKHIRTILLAIPAATLLWLFRTHDVEEQITKSQDSINLNILFKGIDGVNSQNEQEIRSGFTLLVKLRSDGYLKSEIDTVTRNIRFTGTSFIGVKFDGLDLTNAKFENKNYSNIDFRDCTFNGTNLSSATFDRATFYNVEMLSSQLIGTVFINVELKGKHNIPISKATVENIKIPNNWAIDEEYIKDTDRCK